MVKPQTTQKKLGTQKKKNREQYLCQATERPKWAPTSADKRSSQNKQRNSWWSPTYGGGTTITANAEEVKEDKEGQNEQQ